MRILAAADVHGFRNIYKWLVATAAKESADVLVLAGDLFAMDSESALRHEADWLVALLRQAGRPVLYIMGNDDMVALNYEDDHIKPLHNRRIPWGEYSFVGYQYSLPFVGEIFEKTEEEIEKDVRSLELLLDAHTILVTHSPARGILDRTFGDEHVGSQSLAVLLERRPVLAHLHGHIHESFGREGNHFNVASAGRSRAFVIDVPSLEHRVVSESFGDFPS